MNSTAAKIWVAVGATLLVALLLLAFNVVGTLDHEATGRNLVVAQQTNVKSYTDKTWKVIKQEAQVPEKYHQDFKDNFGTLINDRYGDKSVAEGKAFLSFIVEHNPQYDSTLYANVQHAIESLRGDLVNEETRLIDMDREHDTPFDHIWSGFWLRLCGRQRTSITVVTSEKTEEIFKNGGQENDVDVFK